MILPRSQERVKSMYSLQGTAENLQTLEAWSERHSHSVQHDKQNTFFSFFGENGLKYRLLSVLVHATDWAAEYAFYLRSEDILAHPYNLQGTKMMTFFRIKVHHLQESSFLNLREQLEMQTKWSQVGELIIHF